MSVSILVDNLVRFEGSGPKAKRILEPPPPDRMKAIHDLVAGVVGLSTERGDQLVLESQPFESTRNWEPPPAAGSPAAQPTVNGPAWLQNLMKNRVMFLGAIGAGALLVLLLGLAVVMLARKKKRKGAEIQQQIAASSTGAAISSGDDVSQKIESQLAEQAAIRERQNAEAMNALKLPPVTTKKAEVLTKHILEEAKKDPKVMAQIVRSWINETAARS